MGLYQAMLMFAERLPPRARYIFLAHSSVTRCPLCKSRQEWTVLHLDQDKLSPLRAAHRYHTTLSTLKHLQMNFPPLPDPRQWTIVGMARKNYDPTCAQVR
jgi:hypothetical protein